MRAARRTILATAAALAIPGLGRAQPRWPNGPIRLIVTFPAGGSLDTVARLAQPHLQAELGVPVVVENRPGASGALGTQVVARAAPDGQSWGVVFDTHATNPALIPNIGFDTERDLTPLLLFGTAPMLLTRHRTRPWANFAEMAAAARARPDTLTYGTIGNGSLAHLTMALMMNEAGFQATHVPFNGSPPAAMAVAQGTADATFMVAPALLPHVKNNKVRLLATSAAQRPDSLKDLPTLAEAGYPQVESLAWNGLFTATGTPAAVVARINADVNTASTVWRHRRSGISSTGSDSLAQEPA
jgi:tripartite-type tricarboxylate transporter receptor subunit TctC